MPSKKPSPTNLPATPDGDAPVATKPSIPTAAHKRLGISQPNPRQQPDNRWQRTKRYGWDSR